MAIERHRGRDDEGGQQCLEQRTNPKAPRKHFATWTTTAELPDDSTLWNGVLEHLPFEGDELVPNTKGKPRGDSDFSGDRRLWFNAGFTGEAAARRVACDGPGREYSAPGIAPDEFATISSSPAGLRRQRKEDLQLRLATEILPPDRRAETIRSTSAIFVNRGSASYDSVFAPGRGVWRSDVVAELRERFIGRPEVDGAVFLEKLATQFTAPATTRSYSWPSSCAGRCYPSNNQGERKKRV